MRPIRRVHAVKKSRPAPGADVDEEAPTAATQAAQSELLAASNLSTSDLSRAAQRFEAHDWKSATP